MTKLVRAHFFPKFDCDCTCTYRYMYTFMYMYMYMYIQRTNLYRLFHKIWLECRPCWRGHRAERLPRCRCSASCTCWGDWCSAPPSSLLLQHHHNHTSLHSLHQQPLTTTSAFTAFIRNTVTTTYNINKYIQTYVYEGISISFAVLILGHWESGFCQKSQTFKRIFASTLKKCGCWDRGR